MPALLTWYAAVPIAKRDDGRFTCDYTQAIECQSAEEAAQFAAVIARKPGYSAAVVFADRRSAGGVAALCWRCGGELDCAFCRRR